MKMAPRSSQRQQKQISKLIDELNFGSQGGSQQMKKFKRKVRDGKFYIGYEDKYDEWKDFDEDSEFPVAKLEKLSLQIMKLSKKGQLFLAEGFI